VCVCVCVCERERERERMCVYLVPDEVRGMDEPSDHIDDV